MLQGLPVVAQRMREAWPVVRPFYLHAHSHRYSEYVAEEYGSINPQVFYGQQRHTCCQFWRRHEFCEGIPLPHLLVPWQYPACLPHKPYRWTLALFA